MLTLADAVFDREDGQLVPTAGTCTECVKRTGANTVLFDDFQQDDKCLDGGCFRAKVDAHIERQKRNVDDLVQITRAYYSNNQSGEKILTRNEYTMIEPTGRENDGNGEQQSCRRSVSAIVVEGPGRRGEIVEVCADPECEVHGRADHRTEREAAALERKEEQSRRALEQENNRQNNRRLLDLVLDNLPTTLARDDYQMLVFAAIDRFEYGDWEAITERYQIDANESEEPDALAFELRKSAEEADQALLVRMLVEFALLRSGYSEERLEPSDPLANAARRYSAPLESKRTSKMKGSKCLSKRDKVPSKPKRRKAAPGTAKSPKRVVVRKGRTD